MQTTTTWSTRMKQLYGGRGDPLLGLHVSHIIAESRGGANHPDNYILLSGKYNIKTKRNADFLNAYLAGPEKTRKAMEISRLVGNMKGKVVTPLNKDEK